jgi:CubicO group peptidase (beta-lactamase class C family)
MLMKKLAIVVLAFAAWTFSSANETPDNSGPISPAGELSKSERVDALFPKLVKGKAPGAAVIVIRDGKVVLEKGYGLANLETQKPITPDTAFLLASVTKQFTAMAIMILAERRELNYEDPLGKFFPEFLPFAGEVTVRMLLNHTAGFPEYDELFLDRGLIDKDWPRSSKSPRSAFEPTSKDALKLLADAKTLKFRPGEKYEYSNSGYVILAQIVEKVSGKRFSKFLKDNIFDPLGMNRTVLYDETRPTVSNVATSYALEEGAYRDIDYTPLNYIYGEDNIYTTVQDMARWDQALHTAKLVNEATLKEAFTPGKPRNGTSAYGFGWLIDAEKVFHGGAWVGFTTAIIRFREHRLSVVVLANSTEFKTIRIAREISEIYLSKATAE